MNSLIGKNILVTSGGTREYIDDVRVLTNVSSGRLGAMISERCHKALASVYHIGSKGSVRPVDLPNIHYEEISTVAELKHEMEHLLKRRHHNVKIDAVVMTVAASDFTFKRDKQVKLKSNDAEGFIEYMRQTITPNPKLISLVKKWCPDVYLVGFKFEVGLEHEELVRVAKEAGKKNGCDLMVANDKVEMEQQNSHVAHLLGDGWEEMCRGKELISDAIVNHLMHELI